MSLSGVSEPPPPPSTKTLLNFCKKVIPKFSIKFGCTIQIIMKTNWSESLRFLFSLFKVLDWLIKIISNGATSAH